MAIAPPDLLVAFPEFSNVTTYPTATVQFWITQGYSTLNASLFGTDLDYAVMLYTAHNVVLAARNARDGAAGQIVGDVKGPVASKTVGPVSISYSGASNTTGAGEYNLTSYGQRLYALMQAYSAGPKYVPRTVTRWGSLRGY